MWKAGRLDRSLVRRKDNNPLVGFHSVSCGFAVVVHWSVGR